MPQQSLDKEQEASFQILGTMEVTIAAIESGDLVGSRVTKASSP
jgi:hypothetical protein